MKLSQDFILFEPSWPWYESSGDVTRPPWCDKATAIVYLHSLKVINKEVLKECWRLYNEEGIFLVLFCAHFNKGYAPVAYPCFNQFQIKKYL